MNAARGRAIERVRRMAEELPRRSGESG